MSAAAPNRPSWLPRAVLLVAAAGLVGAFFAFGLHYTLTLESLHSHRDDLVRVRDRNPVLFGGRAPMPAAVWRSVAYSRVDTGARLAEALRRFGPIGSIPALADTDEASDLPELASALGCLRDPLPEQASLRDWLRNLRQTPAFPELAQEIS